LEESSDDSDTNWFLWISIIAGVVLLIGLGAFYFIKQRGDGTDYSLA